MWVGVPVKVGFPTGWLQLQLLQHLPEEELRRRGFACDGSIEEDTRRLSNHDEAKLVIDYLEGTLSGSRQSDKNI